MRLIFLSSLLVWRLQNTEGTVVKKSGRKKRSLSLEEVQMVGSKERRTKYRGGTCFFFTPFPFAG